MAITQTDRLSICTLVTHDAGFYAVSHGVSLHKDKPPSVESRANSNRYHCDDARCRTKLLGTW